MSPRRRPTASGSPISAQITKQGGGAVGRWPFGTEKAAARGQGGGRLLAGAYVLRAGKVVDNFGVEGPGDEMPSCLENEGLHRRKVQNEEVRNLRREEGDSASGGLWNQGLSSGRAKALPSASTNRRWPPGRGWVGAGGAPGWRLQRRRPHRWSLR